MFKEIYTMPEFIRDEKDENYRYPEENVEKVFQYQNNYIIFHENSNEQLSKSLVDNIIIPLIAEKLNNEITDVLNKRMDEYENNNESIEILNKRLEDITEQVNEKVNSDEFVQLCTDLKDQLKIKSEGVGISEDIVKEMITEQLQTVYEYIQKEKEDKPVQKEKISIGTLFALKEAGYTAKEIGELKKENLI